MAQEPESQARQKSNIPRHNGDIILHPKYADDVFPNRLGPFGITRTHFRSHHFGCMKASRKGPEMFQLDTRQIYYDKSGNLKRTEDFVKFLSECDSMIRECGLVGNVSPYHDVTLDDNSKNAAKIPIAARRFAWLYPSILPVDALAKHRDLETWLQDPNITLLTVGGYAYFNRGMDLLAINTLVPALDGGLQFGAPRKWDNTFTRTLQVQGRFQAITIAALSDTGARYFAWIFPDEKLQNQTGEERLFCQHGGFVYLFHEPFDKDPELVALDRYFEVISGEEYEEQQKQLAMSKPARGEVEKKWRITWLEQKKQQLKQLRQQLAAQMQCDDTKEETETGENVELPKQKSLSNMKRGEVSQWLQRQEMTPLVDKFRDNEIDGTKLQQLCALNNGGNNDSDGNAELRRILKSIPKRELITLAMFQLRRGVRIQREKDEISNVASDEVQQLRDKIKRLEDEIELMEECIVCLTNKKDHILRPCNHIVSCRSCAIELETCPMCRAEIQSYERVYS